MPDIEKLGLLSATYHVICKANVIKYMLSRSILRGRLGKWAYSLIEFVLGYFTDESRKGASSR